MWRMLLLVIAIGSAAGCQAQNPYAAFGPPTIAAPTTTHGQPYYPPAAAPQRANPNAIPPNQRLSVSAETTPIAQVPRTSVAADPADRAPIRVVENAAAAARTAAVTPRVATPANALPAPATSPPGAKPVTPTNGMPAAGPKAAPQSGYAPSGRAPAFNRTRGYISGEPSTGGSVDQVRTDSAVVPAGYQQPSPAFVETPMATGQWRAR
jgi:hypothetical protein